MDFILILKEFLLGGCCSFPHPLVINIVGRREPRRASGKISATPTIGFFRASKFSKERHPENRRRSMIDIHSIESSLDYWCSLNDESSLALNFFRCPFLMSIGLIFAKHNDSGWGILSRLSNNTFASIELYFFIVSRDPYASWSFIPQKSCPDGTA